MGVFSLAFRNLRRRPLSTTMTALGLIVAVAYMVALITIILGARMSIDDLARTKDPELINEWREFTKDTLSSTDERNLEEYIETNKDKEIDFYAYVLQSNYSEEYKTELNITIFEIARGNTSYKLEQIPLRDALADILVSNMDDDEVANYWREHITRILSKYHYFVALVTLIVAIIGITNTMLMSILERTREIGILKCIGASNSRVLKIFLSEVLIIGFFAGLIGFVAGFAAASFTLASSLENVPVITSPLSVMPQLLAASFALSLGCSLLAGIIPARRAAKMDPEEALKYEW